MSLKYENTAVYWQMLKDMTLVRTAGSVPRLRPYVKERIRKIETGFFFSFVHTLELYSQNKSEVSITETIRVNNQGPYVRDKIKRIITRLLAGEVK